VICLLIDENLPASLAKHLPVKTFHATELGDRPRDSELWEVAKKNDWAILTRDTDFFDRIMLDGPPPKVIWIRLGNIRKRDLESSLAKLWSAITGLLENADLVEVHPHALEAVQRSNANQEEL
jgi:predicted nuclease of predicted toxin-antitoxin system